MQPRNTLILEDHTLKKQLRLWCKIDAYQSTDDVTYENIISFIKEDNPEYNINNSWEDKNLNIVIPMAGEGSRFVNAGYSFPNL